MIPKEHKKAVITHLLTDHGSLLAISSKQIYALDQTCQLQPTSAGSPRLSFIL